MVPLEQIGRCHTRQLSGQASDDVGPFASKRVAWVSG